MNSFKLINTTNKNDIVSNNLNGIESKEKEHSKETISRSTAISIKDKNKNENNKENLVSNDQPFGEDALKTMNKRLSELKSKDNDIIIPERKESKEKDITRIIHERKESRDIARIIHERRESREINRARGIHEKKESREKQDIVCIIPERKESKLPELINNPELYFTNQTKKANEKNDGQPQIFITPPYSTVQSFNPEISKESQIKSNYESNSTYNGNLPVCLSMTTPSNPARNSVVPVINSDYNHSIDGGKGYMTGNNEQASYGREGAPIKLESLFKGNNSENNESIQNITENDRLSQEQVMEVRNREVPMKYKTNSIIEDEFYMGKDKSGQKSNNNPKRKENKTKNHTSISTNLDSNETRSSSSQSSVNQRMSNTPSSPSTQRMSNTPSSPSMSDTKKKKWKSFKKLFGKKSSKKPYRHDNSSSSVIEDSRRNTSSINNIGINYDWNELRRRMEEENSTVYTETLSAREFADAIGIQIISSDDEEENMNFNNENDYSLLADVHSTYNSHYASTHRSARSSAPPPLDMSIFTPPTKEEKENNNNNNNNDNNNNTDDHDQKLQHEAENDAESNDSTTNQDFLANLRNSSSKEKLFGDNQSSIFTNNKINFQNLPEDFFNDVFENAMTVSTVGHKKSTAISNGHSLPYYPPSSKNQSNSRSSWFNTYTRGKSSFDGDEEKKNDVDDSVKINDSMTDSKDASEINESSKTNSLERKRKPSPPPINTDIKDKICHSKNGQLEDEHKSACSYDSPMIRSAVHLDEERSPSISIRSDDSVVQEYQKGRFTVTKENTTNSGHRVFIVTKDEEDENGDSITTVSSISSLGKFTYRRRSSSQPLSAAMFTPLDQETKSPSSQKKSNASLLKFGSSIPNLSDLDMQRNKSNTLTTSRSQVFSSNDNCSSLVSKRRKSTMSLDPSLLNNNYSTMENEDIEGHHDSLANHFESENDSKLNKGKNGLYSVEANNNKSSSNNNSSALNPQISSLPRSSKGKKSNSRFQITYTPSSSTVSPSLKSVHTNSPSSKPVKPKVSRLASDETSSIEQTTRGLSKSFTESTEMINHYFSEEERIGHQASNSSSAISSPATSPLVSPFHSLRQPINSNINQRTVCSISSLLTENGNSSYSNSQSPPLNGVKINSNYEASKPISIVNSSTYDNTPHNERLNSMDSSFFPPTPPKVQDTSSDYYNFFKYNDSYNSIFLSSLSKEKERPNNKNNDTDNNKNTQNILDELNKTEDNEILTEIDKNVDLSESSSLSPYSQRARSTSPLEKPPVLPNSPISNIDSNITGDDSFHEIPTHARKASKASSIVSSTTSPTVRPSNTNTSNASKKTRLYRSPSVSSTTTNGSSRFTVIRESNEKHSPNFSASKVVTKKYSNVHSSPLISPSDSMSSVNSLSVPSSKLKPSMVVIQGSDDKPKPNSGTVTTSTQSTNVGRFTVTVTRETFIS